MSLYVLIYPQLSCLDAMCLERFRVRHEPIRSGLVDAHFTLVFGTDLVDTDALVCGVREAADEVGRFPISLQSVTRGWDPVSNEFKLYLLPTIGSAQITGLHDRLYAGELSRDLRTDVSFYPHMTISTSTLESEIVRAEAQASRLQLPIAGEVEAITIAEMKDAALAEVASVALRPA